MKNRIKLLFFSIIISTFFVTLDYGMISSTLKKTKTSLVKPTKRYYNTGFWNKLGRKKGAWNKFNFSFQYLKNKFNQYLSYKLFRQEIPIRKTHLMGHAKSITVPYGIPSQIVLAKRTRSKSYLPDLTTVLLQDISFNINPNLSFQDKKRVEYEIRANVEKRYDTLSQLLSKEKSMYQKNQNSVVLYKPIRKSEAALLYTIFVQIEHATKGGFTKTAGEDLIIIDKSNDKNWRISPFCRGDNYKDQDSLLDDSILSQAIRGESVSSNQDKRYIENNESLEKLAEMVIETYMKTIPELQFKSNKTIGNNERTCIEKIVDFVKEINNEVLIAQTKVNLGELITDNPAAKYALETFLEEKNDIAFLDNIYLQVPSNIPSYVYDFNNKTDNIENLSRKIEDIVHNDFDFYKPLTSDIFEIQKD